LVSSGLGMVADSDSQFVIFISSCCSAATIENSSQRHMSHDTGSDAGTDPDTETETETETETDTDNTNKHTHTGIHQHTTIKHTHTHRIYVVNTPLNFVWCP